MEQRIIPQVPVYARRSKNDLGFDGGIYTGADCTNEKQCGSKQIVTYKLHGSLFSVEFWLLSL